MYFKISLQIKSRVSNRTSADYVSVTQPEFQCVYTKLNNKNTMKPKHEKTLFGTEAKANLELAYSSISWQRKPLIIEL